MQANAIVSILQLDYTIVIQLINVIKSFKFIVYFMYVATVTDV